MFVRGIVAKKINATQAGIMTGKKHELGDYRDVLMHCVFKITQLEKNRS